MARQRAGRQFDPTLAALARARTRRDASTASTTSATWDAVIDAEPALAVVLSGERFDAALLAIANFVDLKSPYTLGHSRAVAELVAAAGRAARPRRGRRRARCAAPAWCTTSAGSGVSNAIWDKPGPLGAGEWERVRLHPYLTERMLRQSPALAPLGAIAVQHRERLDGSGYPRGLAGRAISRARALLGAADAYQAMREPRPHRAGAHADDAAAASYEPTSAPAGSTATRSRPSSAPPAIACARRRDGPAV